MFAGPFTARARKAKATIEAAIDWFDAWRDG